MGRNIMAPSTKTKVYPEDPMTTDAERELVRKLTETNKIADFGMQVLGMDERRAEAFTKVCGDFLKWDGTLQFKTASGQYVAADDEQCTGFFRREFDYLIPAKPAGEDQQADISAELVEKARTNLTARGQVYSKLYKGKGSEAETQAALDKLLKGEAPKDGDRKRDESGKFVREHREADVSNPWSRDGWNLTNQGRVVRNDPARAERLAKSAHSFIGATRPAA
jgi:hypothetical protein